MLLPSITGDLKIEFDDEAELIDGITNSHFKGLL